MGMGEESGEAESLDEYINRVGRLSATIISAKNGSEEAKEQLQEYDRLELVFPKSREVAMGGALEFVEKLEEAGIESEREYIREVDDFHRIDIVLE